MPGLNYVHGTLLLFPRKQGVLFGAIDPAIVCYVGRIPPNKETQHKSRAGAPEFNQLCVRCHEVVNNMYGVAKK